MRIIPHVNAFVMYLWGDGELHVLFLCHIHSLPIDSWDIIYTQCKVIGYTENFEIFLNVKYINTQKIKLLLNLKWW